ncbi:MAG: diversity-generating retroelement protein Avd [Gammaproteobacteria bacterium]
MSDATPQAVQAGHELLLWLIPQIDKFPRVRRFTLGERLESVLLEVLELSVEAAYTHNKRAALQKANLRLEVAKHLWRLALELKSVALRRYEHGVRLMDELGRQLGGWLRSLETPDDRAGREDALRKLQLDRIGVIMPLRLQWGIGN